MKITLSSQKTIINKSKTLTASELEILKIVDTPSKKYIGVIIKGLGRIKINTLSGTNYDNPQWTNESLVTAVTEQLNSV